MADYKKLTAALAVSLVLFSADFAFSQSAVQMSMTELKDASKEMIDKKDYVSARPYIEQLIVRINDSDDKKMKAQLPSLYFFKAYSYLQDYAKDNQNTKILKLAITDFDKLLELPQNEYTVDAIKAKASCYDGLRQFVKGADTREVLLKPPFSNKISFTDQFKLVKQTANGFYNCEKLEDFDSGEKWYKLMLARAHNQQDKVFAASALIQTAIHKKDFAMMRSYLKYLRYDVPARNDIKLNLMLLNAGDALVAASKYSDASLLFGMVLDRDVMIENYKRFSKLVKTALDSKKIPAEEIPEFEAQLKLYEMQINFIRDNIKENFRVGLMARAARNYMLTKRDYESYWSYRQLYETFPESDNIEDFYYAAFAGAMKIKKNDDMQKIGTEYSQKFQAGKYKNEIDFYMTLNAYNKKEYKKFIEDAKVYVKSMPDDPHAADMVFIMGKCLVEQKNYDELLKIFSQYDKEYADMILREPCLYWMGMGCIAKGDYKNAASWFGKLVDNFPTGPYAEDASYRKGVAEFGTGEFTKSRDTFESFLNTYSDSSLCGEVEFFLGDIYAGVGQIEIAMRHYSEVERKTKNMAFIDNAYVQAAKLLHTYEMYTREAELMDKYMKLYPDGDVSNIALNKGAAMELLGQPVEAIELYYNTILKCGGNPADDGVDKLILDYKRLFVEGYAQTKATVEFLDMMLKDKRFYNTMLNEPGKRYQHFLRNPKIDKNIYNRLKNDKKFIEFLSKTNAPIKKLYDAAKKELDTFPKGGVETIMKKLLAKAQELKNPTLEYRLKMGMDSMGMPVKVEKVFGAEDLKKASVRTLVWMGKCNKVYGAAEALKAFDEAKKREEVDFLIDVLFANAELEASQGGDGIGRAIKIYAQIENDFPTSARASEAALRQADMYVKVGNRNEAVKKYETILKYPSYRGDPFAEALYNLGQIAQKEGKTDKALYYYDRCYLGFASCMNWSGKAVLAASKVLAKTDVAKAKAICDEFLDNARNQASPDYKAVKTYRDTL